MHHFEIAADKDTGEWLRGHDGKIIAKYLGEISKERHAALEAEEFAAHLSGADYPYHHDQHDGEALSKDVWEVADGVEPTSCNVAITLKWHGE